MRFQLATLNDARDDSREQDSWGVNCFVEKEEELRAVKRPGLIKTVDVVGSGTIGQGLFIWPDYTGLNPKIVMIWDDQLFVLEYTGPSLDVDYAWDVGVASPASGAVMSAPYPLTFYNPAVSIGDLVSGYYAMVDDPSTSPGPADPYWSLTPPTASRWRGYWFGNYSAYFQGPAAVYPTTPDLLIGAEAASADAAAKVWVEKIVGANLAGVAALSRENSYSPDAVTTTYTFNTPTSYTYPVSTDKIQMSANVKAAIITNPYPDAWWTVADWTGPTTANTNVGRVRELKTTSDFTITASGTTATLTSGTVVLNPYQWFEISGCDQPEYNGIFYATQPIPNPRPWLAAVEWKFTLPGVPAASPATGTKSLKYFGAL